MMKTPRDTTAGRSGRWWWPSSAHSMCPAAIQRRNVEVAASFSTDSSWPWPTMDWMSSSLVKYEGASREPAITALVAGRRCGLGHCNPPSTRFFTMSIWNASMLSSRCCIHCVCLPRQASAGSSPAWARGAGPCSSRGTSMEEGMGAAAGADPSTTPSARSVLGGDPHVPAQRTRDHERHAARGQNAVLALFPVVPAPWRRGDDKLKLPLRRGAFRRPWPTIAAPTQTSPSLQVSRAASSGFHAPREASEPTITRLNPKSRLACTANATVVRVAAPAGTFSFSAGTAFGATRVLVERPRDDGRALRVRDRVRVALGRAPSAVAPLRRAPGRRHALSREGAGGNGGRDGTADGKKVTKAHNLSI